MPTLQLITQINAPIEHCFDLARDPSVHTDSAHRTQERVIGGRTEGYFEFGDIVTWEAVHFLVKQRLTVRITEMTFPTRFVDELVSGAFRELQHVHEFAKCDGGTRMVDTFSFESPLGLLGRLVNALILNAAHA